LEPHCEGEGSRVSVDAERHAGEPVATVGRSFGESLGIVNIDWLEL
jgi:hypothetical protein